MVEGIAFRAQVRREQVRDIAQHDLPRRSEPHLSVRLERGEGPPALDLRFQARDGLLRREAGALRPELIV